jgi:tetratricopeptide (TPR) repeat protein
MAQPAKRIKISRKALRQPDEFQTVTTRAADWASDHMTLVVGVAGAVAAVLLVVVLIRWYQSSQAEQATLRFHEAYTVFENGKYDQAAEAFAGVAREFTSTPFGRLAVLYRAHALARQGDAAGAAAAYGEYLATSPATDYLRQQALDGLGHAKEATGDTAGAREDYEQAGTLRGPFRTDALLGAARLHEAAGQREKAQAIYAELLKDESDPELKALLVAKLPPGQAPATEPSGETEP